MLEHLNEFGWPSYVDKIKWYLCLKRTVYFT
jgi:hypothetical protein